MQSHRAAPRGGRHHPKLGACILVSAIFSMVLLCVLALILTQRPRPARRTAQPHAATGAVLSAADIARYRTAAAVIDPEMAAQAPHNFSQAYRNPCWEVGGTLKCLPYFFLSGFHTGAGNLAKRLLKHPDIVMDAGTLSYWGPTWGYWSEYRNSLGGYISGITGAASGRLAAAPGSAVVMEASMSTFALYWAASGKAHRAFSTHAVDCWRDCNKRHGGSSGVAYEACMDTICLPKGRAEDEVAARRAGLDYADLQLPMLIRAVYGAAPPKLVFVLRDPVERIFSAYFGLGSMHGRHGNSTAGFDAFVAEQLAALRRCVDGPPLATWRNVTVPAESSPGRRLASRGGSSSGRGRGRNVGNVGSTGWSGVRGRWLQGLGNSDSTLHDRNDHGRRRRSGSRRTTKRAAAAVAMRRTLLQLPAAGAAAAAAAAAGHQGVGRRHRSAAKLAKEAHCALYFESLRMDQEKVFFHCDQLFRGMYSTYLEIWLRYFPRESILIVKSSDYFSDWKGTTRRVLDFLELPHPTDSAAWQAMEAAGPARSNVRGRGAVPPAALGALREFYWPYNEDLARLLGDPAVSHWNHA